MELEEVEEGEVEVVVAAPPRPPDQGLQAQGGLGPKGKAAARLLGPSRPACSRGWRRPSKSPAISQEKEAGPKEEEEEGEEEEAWRPRSSCGPPPRPGRRRR